MFPRWKIVGAALVVAVMSMPAVPAAPVPASASDSALAVVPAQAPIVIHIRGVDRVRDRLKAMVQAAAPDFAPMAVGAIDNMMGQFFAGRKMTGVVPNGPVFIALMEMPNAEQAAAPPMAVIVRITKFAEFRDNFLKDDEKKELKTISEGIERCELNGMEAFLVDKRDYAVIAPSKQIAETMAKGFAGMDGKMPKELAAKMLENDISAYVNLTTVNQMYGDQIRQGREMMMGLMDQAMGMDKNQVEMAKKVYGGMFQVVLDGKALVIATDFRPEGFAVHLQAQVGAESDTNQVLRTQKPVALDGVGKLPAGQMTYTATDLGPEMTRMMAAIMKGAVSAEGDAMKLIDAAYTQLGAAKGRAMFASSDVPPAGVSFQEFADPTQALSGTLAMYKGMGAGASAMGGAVKGPPEIKPDAESFRNIKFTSVRLTWDLDKMTEQIPGAGEGVKDAMKKMMGTGLSLWIGVEGNRLLTVSGKDWNDAKSRVEAFLDGKKSVNQVPAFQSTAKNLPGLASMVYFIDAGPFTNTMVEYMVALFKAMPGIPFNLPDSVKPVPTDTAFIGFAVTLQPERGSADMFLPVKAVEEMKKVVMQMFMGG